MHMADALLSPAVGGAMWALSGGTIAFCAKKVQREVDDSKIPLMGVLGAFLFAAQMINFTIPATGSSGHLGGGLLLTILLGPYAAFLAISSVLVVQALFFADGGLLALGCNIFNLGFLPAFVAYPLIYKKIAGERPSQGRMTIAALIAAVVGLQLGAFGVVLETYFSGISSLPFKTFVILMQPIHLAIGMVEGLVTVAIVSFVYKARPEILQGATALPASSKSPIRALLLFFFIAALLTGGVVSWYASENPDGLEWAIAKVTGKEELTGPEKGIYGILSALQEKTAILPDYSFKKTDESSKEAVKPEEGQKGESGARMGTSLAGVIGAIMTLALAFVIGYLLKIRNRSAS